MIVKTLKKELKKSHHAIEQLKDLYKAEDLSVNQRRSIAARILGVHRRFKQTLLIEVTSWAFETDKSQTSKHKIEQWQETNFGHSISNNKLVLWCDRNRTSGERAELKISDETTSRAKDLYSLFEHAIKTKEIDELKLRQFAGQVLSDDLGL